MIARDNPLSAAYSSGMSTSVVCAQQSSIISIRSGLNPMTKSLPCATTGTPTPPVSARHSRSSKTSFVMSASSNSQPCSLSQSLTRLQ